MSEIGRSGGSGADDDGAAGPGGDADDDDRTWVHDDDDVLRPVRGPTSLGSELSSLVATRRWGSRLRGAAIFGRWEEIVGAELAQRCEPVRLAGGVLVVRAGSAAWATQVGYLSHELVARVRAVLGPDMIRTVKVTVGPLERGASSADAGGGNDAPDRRRTGPQQRPR